MPNYTPTIGLEIHPDTTTSLCSVGYGAGAEL